MDTSKLLFQKYGEKLKDVQPSSRIACISDQDCAESLGVDIDIPFNVLSVKKQQGVNVYILDVTHGKGEDTIEVPEDKLDFYFGKEDILSTAEDHFDTFVDIQDIDQIYELADIEDEFEDDLDDGLDDDFLDNYV